MCKKIKDGLLSNYLRRARYNKLSYISYLGEVLDIGCDEGQVIPTLPKKVRYTGIDINSESIKKAKKKYPIHKFYRIDINKDDFSGIKFDTILLFAILEHLEKPIRTINKLYSILTDNSILMITSPSKRLIIYLFF